ncbi:hypothetical protein ANCCAN_04126 [Ancylostoma caninum]|uniref:NAD-dependent epimerase/dehydratase domain-containing protein n=1 Tax=Ancylostoma caninum TaxID=29170 RepID=A0A368H3P4_ANCCA|nr:hypothetical protein ANCCAN_04126 [Ancylostoma caninum]
MNRDIAPLTIRSLQIQFFLTYRRVKLNKWSSKYMYGDGHVVMTDIVKAPRNATDVSNYSFLDILNRESIERMVVDNGIDTIVHYSALLSAVGEQNVPLALQVNCRGVENVLEVAKYVHI